jgi:hypothetical protein
MSVKTPNIDRCSDAVRKRITKDWKLPILMNDKEHWNYAVGVLSSNRFLAVYSAVSLAEKLLRKLPERSFMGRGRDIAQQAIAHVQSCEGYDRWLEFKPDTVDAVAGVGKGSIYRPENDGAWFITIDLVKANWQVMEKVVPSLFRPNGAKPNEGNSYETWIQHFTEEPYFVQSKQIRQVIFGNLRPKAQQKQQRYYITKIANRLEEFLGLAPHFASMTNDELILRFENQPSYNLINEVKKVASDVANVHHQAFCLRRLPGSACYVREFALGGFDIKNTPRVLYLQAYKTHTGQTVNEKDMTFLHEGELATFKEPYFKGVDYGK